MIAIKFKQKHLNYGAGEIAGFRDNIANELLEKGVAELYKVEKKKEVKKVSKPTSKK